MYAKLVFGRPGGLWLTIERKGPRLIVNLLDGCELVLARAAGDAADSYVFELNDRHHGLNVGRDSSFDVTPREAAAIREELGIGSRPIGDGTSFEVAQPAPQSTRDLLLSVIKSGTEIAAGVTLERVACRSLDASGGPQ